MTCSNCVSLGEKGSNICKSKKLFAAGTDEMSRKLKPRSSNNIGITLFC